MNESCARRGSVANEMLRDALGDEIAAMLDDERTNDVLLNEDGRVWIGRIGEPLAPSGITLSVSDATTALLCIADSVGEPLTRAAPILHGTLPESGERIAGTIPPVTVAPTFAIRRPSAAVLPLECFPDAPDADIAGSDGFAVAECYSGLPARVAAAATAVDQRRFVLVAGNTGSGKTTLMNSLMALPSVSSDRLCVIEDQREIRIGSGNGVRFATCQSVNQHTLVQLALRYRPDRIVLGEVRSGPAALEMIDAANTGHDGGLCTIHANTARDALDRLAGLCSRVTTQTPFHDVARAVGCVVFATRTGLIREVALVDGYQDGRFALTRVG